MEVVVLSLALILASGTSVLSEVALAPLLVRSFEAHNQYRAKHGSPAMTYNATLSMNAFMCADHYIEKGVIDHSCPSKGDAGENLFMWKAPGSVPVLSDEQYASLAAKQFYDEIKFYNFSNPEWVPQAEHFTQVVWKSSTNIAVAMAVKQPLLAPLTNTRPGETIVVIVNLYYPAGNVAPLFAENVLPAVQ